MDCMMGVVLYLILWCCGIRAVLPAVALPPSEQESVFEAVSPTTEETPIKKKQEQVSFISEEKRWKKYESQLETRLDWKCPHIVDITNISCTCDIPHTVRCRGQASSPARLLNLTRELSSTKDPSKTISLLDLALHGITFLPSLTFHELPLQGLVIRTGMESLSPEAFKGLEDILAALGLPANNLTAVPAEALKNMRKLQRLDLSDNRIEVLVLHAFPTLLQLQNLNLAGNGLRKIEREAFARLPQLKTLDLSGNQIDASQINEKTLWGLHLLADLSLENNLLKGTVTSAFLNTASGLMSLNLSYNSFIKVAFGALQSCSNLRSLDLSHNKIDIVEDHAFKFLSKLQHLQLSHNQIISVSGWSLAHLPQLGSLNLANNALFAVTADLLHQLPNLKSLDLATNDISLLQPDVFNYTPILESLNLADNPLHCDCSLTWLLTWLRQHSSLTESDRNSVVCTTPPALENAPLAELNSTDLTCLKDVADYYHDAADYEELYEFRLSDAEVSLQAASWVGDDVQLVWRIDQRALPYSCQAVHIYEMEKIQGTVHQILAEKIEVNCSSEKQIDPHQIVVTVPRAVLNPGGIYRYCLVLLEKGTDDAERFLPGCSEALMLTDPPTEIVPQPKQFGIKSLTAGSMGTALVVQTRFGEQKIPCSYKIFVVANTVVATSRQLNCSEVRHIFPSLVPGNYVVCVEHQVDGIAHNISDIQQILSSSSNTTVMLQETFPACRTVQLQDESGSKWYSGPLSTLLFTLPGLALIITLYVIGRRVWKGGGIPWKWDPRASKRAKYFLYTGETSTPTVSLDPLPVPQPESSV